MSSNPESFADAPVLLELFDTRTQLETQIENETTALAAVDPIMSWVEKKALELAKDASGKALAWASSRLLEAIGLGGGPSELEQIKIILNKIYMTQLLILQKIDTLLREVQFEHLITRSFEAVQKITSRYERLIALTNVPEGERKQEAEGLRNDILNANTGVSVDLKTIHDVLVGNNPLNPGGKGLLDLFMERWKGVYTGKQLSPDIPLIAYHDRSYDYLHGLFIVQYMGLSQLANARVGNAQFVTLLNETKKSLENLKKQRQMIDAWIPQWTLEWPQKFFDGRWYLIMPRDPRGNRSPQVLYGSPATGYRVLDYTVQFRGRNNNNGDEEWQFVPTGTTDTFRLVERSRPRYVSNGGNRVEVQPAGNNNFNLRFIMSPKGLPVIGTTNLNQGYLNWASGRGKTNVCFINGIETAVEVDVGYSGH